MEAAFSAGQNSKKIALNEATIIGQGTAQHICLVTAPSADSFKTLSLEFLTQGLWRSQSPAPLSKRKSKNKIAKCIPTIQIAALAKNLAGETFSRCLVAESISRKVFIRFLLDRSIELLSYYYWERARKISRRGRFSFAFVASPQRAFEVFIWRFLSGTFPCPIFDRFFQPHIQRVRR